MAQESQLEQIPNANSNSQSVGLTPGAGKAAKVLDLKPEFSPRADRPGLAFARHFSSSACHPYDSISWVKRDAAISGDDGKVVFEQRDVEVPKFWSQMATNVVVSKYFRGAVGLPERETSVRQLVSRVADTISAWGLKDGYFADASQAEAFNHELTALLVNQYAAFNSPVWFNLGVEEKPQCSACFILSVDDSIDSLLDLQKTEARLFKYGSGAGSNLSSIRSSRERLSGGGTPSGPLSFMRGYDSWAGTIKSGGKTRRAAKMQILDVGHPDIVDFVNAKRLEEEKAWALIEQGYSGQFNAPGGAYASVFFQNSNLSVRVTDDFMQAVIDGNTYPTRSRTTGEVIENIDARDLLNQIAQGTWVCGDPGLQFDDMINNWHTCPNSGRINASNPCSEYMHVDDSACNLASINLLKFLDQDGVFDGKLFCHAVDLLITAQDILVENSSYPTEKIAANAQAFRQLGLGFANLGALLMAKGLAYDSDEGRNCSALLMSTLCGQAYTMSAHIAAELGPYREFAKNSQATLRVIDQHRQAARSLPASSDEPELRQLAEEVWENAYQLGSASGVRNSQTTVLAPTGTIAFMMDCDTTGIEPDIALVKYKRLVDGGLLKIVNHTVPRALEKLGYRETEIEQIVNYINEHETIEGAPWLDAKDLPVFDCAFRPLNGSRSIKHMGHLKMMGVCQPFVSGAISKTVNLPEAATVEDIAESYIEAWKIGLKAVAIYRDNSKRSQPLGTAQLPTKTKISETEPKARRHLPDERNSITHKFSIAGHEGYITVGLFTDGSPGEIFIVMSKEGSTLSGVMDAFATSVSMALQYGVPLTALVKKFAHMRFEPSGMTPNKQIPFARSVMDYIFRWLASKFLETEQQSSLGILPAVSGQPKNAAGQSAANNGPAIVLGKGDLAGVAKNGHANGSNGQASSIANSLGVSFQLAEDAPPCQVCGSSLIVRQGACDRCLNCGSQGGCG